MIKTLLLIASITIPTSAQIRGGRYWARETARLEQDAAQRAMQHNNTTIGDVGEFRLVSPNELVEVRIYKGEWFSESAHANYVVEYRNGDIVISSRDGVVARVGKGYTVIINREQ